MAARDPNKLEPAYLITLAAIVLFPFCCSYLTRSTPPRVKMLTPSQATWLMTMDDSQSGRTATHVAMRENKWRVEMVDPETNRRMVVVHDGQRTASDSPDFSPTQLSALDPVMLLKAIEMVYTRHPSPESVALDGVLCWHSKVNESDEQGEVWLEAKTGFPIKFVGTRKSGRVMAYTFEKFSPTVPADPRLFNADALTPMLGQSPNG